mmetsp:Transcript_42880/g.67253  ORF Transcript_42880/g.67253 Transcript_42880/m.67253 type:complete len:184 (+) Transcript_42880:1247-1798(+)
MSMMMRTRIFQTIYGWPSHARLLEVLREQIASRSVRPQHLILAGVDAKAASHLVRFLYTIPVLRSKEGSMSVLDQHILEYKRETSMASRQSEGGAAGLDVGQAEPDKAGLTGSRKDTDRSQDDVTEVEKTKESGAGNSASKEQTAPQAELQHTLNLLVTQIQQLNDKVEKQGQRIESLQIGRV